MAESHCAFDLGINHFDLANNYGPPYGSAEMNAGRILREDFRNLRDELVISSKAGYDMWPGPYGDGGSRKYLFASLDQSLRRMGLDHVDVFYHHRPDPETPIEETMGALMMHYMLETIFAAALLRLVHAVHFDNPVADLAIHDAVALQLPTHAHDK